MPPLIVGQMPQSEPKVQLSDMGQFNAVYVVSCSMSARLVGVPSPLVSQTAEDTWLRHTLAMTPVPDEYPTREWR